MWDYKSSSELFLQSESRVRKKCWGIPSMVSLTAPSQALTMNLFCPLPRKWACVFPFLQEMSAPCGTVGTEGHRCCNRTPGTAALPRSTQPAHTSCQSHKIPTLLFKVWAFFQEDFQDCRQGSGDVLMSVWSLSPGWSELPSMPGALQPVSRVWRCSTPHSKSQSAEFNVLFTTPRDKFIFLSFSFAAKCCIEEEFKAKENHREKWSFSPFYFFLSFYSFGSFVLQAEETDVIKKVLHLSYI